MSSKNTSSWFIIANPVAGNHALEKCLDTIQQTFRNQNIGFELLTSNYRGHASKIAQAGIQQGFRKIIAIGGDGTNNEVINGIMNQSYVLPSEITYCLLPIGTGNDWVKEYQIPLDLKKWLKMLKIGKTTLQDIGHITYFKEGASHQQYFANVAGMSYDPFVISEMEKLSRPIHNRLAYLIYGLYYVFKYKIPKARIHFNGNTIEDYFYLINAGICRFSGGGMQFVPHAIPNDGKIALTLAGKLTKIGVLINSFRFYNGKIDHHPKVSIYKTKHIKVEAVNEPILVEVDGELLGETPVTFSIIPQALKIIRP